MPSPEKSDQSISSVPGSLPSIDAAAEPPPAILSTEQEPVDVDGTSLVPTARGKVIDVPALQRARAVEKQSPQPGRNTTSPILAVLGNPGVIAGVGSTVVTVSSAPLSSIALGSITLLTAVNTWVNAMKISAGANNVKSDTAMHTVRAGVGGLASELLESPALFSIAQGTTYAVTSIAKFVSTDHDWRRGLVFLTFSFGSFAIAHLVSKDTKHSPREKTLIEKKAKIYWDRMDKGLKKVLSNPGVGFPTGNLSLLLIDTNLPGLVHKPIAGIIFLAGFSLGTFAILKGLKPLVESRDDEKDKEASGISSKVSGAGDIVTGISALFSSKVLTTPVATIIWGVSNIVAGFRMDREKRIRMSQQLMPDSGDSV